MIHFYTILLCILFIGINQFIVHMDEITGKDIMKWDMFGGGWFGKTLLTFILMILAILLIAVIYGGIYLLVQSLIQPA